MRSVLNYLLIIILTINLSERRVQKTINDQNKVINGDIVRL